MARNQRGIFATEGFGELGTKELSKPLQPTVARVQGLEAAAIRAGQAQVRAAEAQARSSAALGNIFEVTGKAVREARKQGVVSGVEQQLQGLELGAKAFSDPQVADLVFSQAAQNDPVVRNAQEQYNQLNLAAQQGRISDNFLRVQAEKITRSAINQSPGFRNEILGAAKQSIGFDPTGSAFRALEKQFSGAGKTPQQQAQLAKEKEVARLMATTGITRNQAERSIANSVRLEMVQNELELKKIQGTSTVEDGMRLVDNVDLAFQMQFSSNLLTQIKQQGGIKDIEGAVAQMKVARLQLKQGLADQLQQQQIPASNQRSIFAEFDKSTVQIEEQLRDGTYIKFLENKKEEAILLTENNLLVNPTMRTIYTIGKSPGMAQTMDLMSKYISDPRQFELLEQTNPALYAAFQSQGITNHIEFSKSLQQVTPMAYNGAIGSNNVEKSLIGTVSIDTIKHDETTPEQKTRALETTLNNVGEIQTLAAFNNNKIRQQVQANPELRKRFENVTTSVLSSGVDNLASNLSQVGAEDFLVNNQLVYNEDTGLFEVPQNVLVSTINNPFVRATGGTIGISPGATAEEVFGPPTEVQAINSEVEKLNTVLRLHDKYKFILNLPPDKKTFANQILQNVQEKTKSLKQQRNQNVTDQLNGAELEDGIQGRSGEINVSDLNNVDVEISVQVPARYSSSLDSIQLASQKVGINPNHLAAIAKVESGLNPRAKAPTSSASGLFQFINGTWSSMVNKYGKQTGIGMGDRFNPDANAVMGALFIRDNARFLERKLGREPNLRELYLAHFSGPGKAAKVLRQIESNPNAPASSVYSPAEIRANRAIFYSRGKLLTIEQAFNRLTNKVVKAANVQEG